VKMGASIYSSHNPYVEGYRVSRLRENLTSGSEGEGLETDQKAPRQSFTRQSTQTLLNYLPISLRLLIFHHFLSLTIQ